MPHDQMVRWWQPDTRLQESICWTHNLMDPRKRRRVTVWRNNYTKPWCKRYSWAMAFLLLFKNLNSCLAVLWLVIKFYFILILQMEIQLSHFYFKNIFDVDLTVTTWFLASVSWFNYHFIVFIFSVTRFITPDQMCWF